MKEQPIFVTDENGHIIARQVLLTLFPNGGMRIKGPSNKDMFVHILQKALEIVRSQNPATTHNGVEIETPKGIWTPS